MQKNSVCGAPPTKLYFWHRYFARSTILTATKDKKQQILQIIYSACSFTARGLQLSYSGGVAFPT